MDGHAKKSDAKYFKEILENSLSPSDMGHFCEYYLRLLNYGIKKHKEKVMCLTGAPNSGKRSLFIPITRIIPARYLFCSLQVNFGYVVTVTALYVVAAGFAPREERSSNLYLVYLSINYYCALFESKYVFCHPCCAFAFIREYRHFLSRNC